MYKFAHSVLLSQKSAQSKRLFCVAFSKATALRIAEPRGLSAFSVSLLAFLCASLLKEKQLIRFGIKRLILQTLQIWNQTLV